MFTRACPRGSAARSYDPGPYARHRLTNLLCRFEMVILALGQGMVLVLASSHLKPV